MLVNLEELRKVSTTIANNLPLNIPEMASILIPSLIGLGILFVLLRSKAGEYPASFIALEWVIKLIGMDQILIQIVALTILLTIAIIDKTPEVVNLWKLYTSSRKIVK